MGRRRLDCLIRKKSALTLALSPRRRSALWRAGRRGDSYRRSRVFMSRGGRRLDWWIDLRLDGWMDGFLDGWRRLWGLRVRHRLDGWIAGFMDKCRRT